MVRIALGKAPASCQFGAVSGGAAITDVIGAVGHGLYGCE